LLPAAFSEGKEVMLRDQAAYLGAIGVILLCAVVIYIATRTQ
jgi:hypothetical protein